MKLPSILIQNANIVNEDKIFQADVLIRDGKIAKVGENLSEESYDEHLDATGLHLFPGMIDDQVHFREPGLTHKAEIGSEARAAVAGGITSYMEMPNTNPQTTNQEELQKKYDRAEQVSLANYSFYIGATNDNLEEVLKTDPKKVCGVKAFMGSSTGNMLVDNEVTLEGLFSKVPMLIATHCEDEGTIRANTAAYKEKYGEEVPISCHPEIRSAEACYKSSSMAVRLAKKHNTRLHILHISTAKELELFSNDKPLAEKRITAEVCAHHIWFSKEDYDKKGTLIKWNPAVKDASDRAALLEAVNNNTIDVLATDHAPHTLEEKSNTYFKAPSGGPLVQHALVTFLELYHQGKISLEKIAEKTAHHPSILFQIEKRGYIRENYFADLVLVDLQDPWTVDRSNVLSKCKWSPFEGQTFKSKVKHTFVSGHWAFKDGTFDESVKGKRMSFER